MPNSIRHPRCKSFFSWRHATLWKKCGLRGRMPAPGSATAEARPAHASSPPRVPLAPLFVAPIAGPLVAPPAGAPLVIARSADDLPVIGALVVWGLRVRVRLLSLLAHRARRLLLLLLLLRGLRTIAATAEAVIVGGALSCLRPRRLQGGWRLRGQRREVSGQRARYTSQKEHEDEGDFREEAAQ